MLTKTTVKCAVKVTRVISTPAGSATSNIPSIPTVPANKTQQPPHNREYDAGDPIWDGLETHEPPVSSSDPQSPGAISLGHLKGESPLNSRHKDAQATLTLEHLKSLAVRGIVLITFPKNEHGAFTKPISIELDHKNVQVPVLLRYEDGKNKVTAMKVDFLGCANIQGLVMHQNEHPQDRSAKEILDNLLQGRCAIEIHFSTPVDATNAREFGDLLRKDRQSPDYMQYHPSVTPSRIPDTPLPVKDTFSSVPEHLTVVGRGAIRSLELEMAKVAKLRLPNVRLALFKLPGAGVRAFHAVTTKPLPLDIGTNFKVTFKATFILRNASRLDLNAEWRGKVVVAMPYTPTGHATLSLRGPKSLKRSGAGAAGDNATNDDDLSSDEDCLSDDDDSYDFFNDIQFFSVINSEADMIKYLQDPKHLVEADLQAIPDDTMLKRTRRGLEAAAVRVVQELSRSKDNFSLTSATMRSVRPNLLPHIDVFESVSPTILRALQVNLNERQRKCFETATAAAGGILSIIGPPGTGKTFLIAKMVAALALKPLHPDATDPATASEPPAPVSISEPYRNACDVLVVAKNNENANDLTLKIDEELREHKPYPIVVRCNAGQTDIGIAKGFEQPNDSIEDNTRRFMSAGDKSFAGHYVPGHMKFFSVGYAELIEAGLPLPAAALQDPHVQRLLQSTLGNDTEYWARFRYLNQLHPGLRTKHERKELVDWIHRLRQQVLKKADVVVTTISLAPSRALCRWMRPRVCFIDEAGKITEADYLSVRGPFPSCSRFVLVGDHNQIGVFDAGLNEQNQPYIAQTRQSPLERFLHVECSQIALNEQYRFPETINALVKGWYGGDLHSHPSVSHRPIDHKFAGVARSLFGSDAPLVVLNAKNSSPHASPIGSKGQWNNGTCSVVMGVVKMILNANLSSGIYQPSDITVISGYKQQNLKHTFNLNNLVTTIRPNAQDRVKVSTIDGAQGMQSEIVIFDFVTSGGLGFMTDPKRLLVGLSRVRAGMIVVGDFAAMRKAIRNRAYAAEMQQDPEEQAEMFKKFANDEVLGKVLNRLEKRAWR
ncbi:hypothetical protein B9Z65_3306 [Elsinoe australis]|uniref:AAA+ ATPase domain-containing protein n=1 Tax=Elsinoe australis TaxID=40998 RepID=A0A2P7ZY22_9PEZI|nr:hypothetical protein B9Z65_3306 [Elsinoe australis]